MRQRSISAIGVAIVGIVPALFGGPIFATVFAILCLIGLHEYEAMARTFSLTTSPVGYLIIIAAAIAALAGGGEQALLGIVAVAVGLPLVIAILAPPRDGALTSWALAVAGSLYLAVPAFATVAIRQSTGPIDRHWLSSLADTLAFGWRGAPRGLAWFLTILLITWMNDTFAYLLGRAFGRHPLIPRVSPKKTVEGAIGGLVGSAIMAVVAAIVFGLDINLLLAIAFGIVLSVVGIFGDLAESFMKRQAGVKDSGTLIPGHGGMLDRLDALLFTFTAGWFMASLVDRLTQ